MPEESERYAAVLQIPFKRENESTEYRYILYEGDKEKGPRIIEFNKFTGKILFEQKYVGKKENKKNASTNKNNPAHTSAL